MIPLYNFFNFGSVNKDEMIAIVVIGSVFIVCIACLFSRNNRLR